NKRRLLVELMPILNLPGKSAAEATFVRDHNEKTLAVVNTLSQLQLTLGAISLTGIDVMRGTAPFQQKNSSHMDWRSFLDALQGAGSPTVSAPIPGESKASAAFFRNTVTQSLAEAESGEAVPVLIVISSPIVFQRNLDLQPLQFQGDCHCHIYH